MNNDWKEEELREAENGAEAEVGKPEEDAAPESGPVELRKRRIWPLVLLPLLLLAAAAILFTLYAPDGMKERYLDQVKQWLPDTQREVTKAQPVIPSKRAEPMPPAVVATPTPKPKPAVTEHIVPASSAEIDRVLDAMDSLQGELTTLRRQQQQLKQQQIAVQTMQLRTRLNWITNSANHLPQLRLAWEEVSLMPLISEDERKLAQSMLALAQKNMNMLKGWQQQLKSTAETLTLREHNNIIPPFENSWLNWITGQFSVRPSLSREEADDAALRQLLLDTSRNLEMELWPKSRDWLELRAKLQLRLIAASKDDASAAPVLELPESFDAIRADIETLRTTAASWLERL